MASVVGLLLHKEVTMTQMRFHAARAANNPQHSSTPWPAAVLPPDETVTVFRVALTRMPAIEGTARIVRAVDPSLGLYDVRFADETRLQCRLVHPGDWQRAPQRMLAALTAHWRIGIDPAFAGNPFDDAY